VNGTPVGTNFKLVFVAVLAITLVCLAGAIYLSVGAQSDPVRATTAHLWTIVDAGMGAIFGLLGGKSI
jgi:hypothetical protein